MSLTGLHVLVAALLGVRILLRPHRQPESRAAWLVVVIAAPFVGAALYALLGETGIGRERTRRLREVAQELPPPCAGAAADLPDAGGSKAAQLFAVGRSISGYPAVSGNSAELKADSDAAIDSIVADIEPATQSAHLLFYIWLDDGNGTRGRRADARGAPRRRLPRDGRRHRLARSYAARCGAACVTPASCCVPRCRWATRCIASGPTYRPSAVPELFATLIYAARHELVITTPYFVPVPELLSALCAAGYRGVAATIIFPARNDDAVVGAICRSHYAALLDAKVRVFEFQPGLLHTKSLTLDGEVTLIGSANLDRRSFDLNYENNILLHDAACTQLMRMRQMAYLQQSREVTRAEVEAWPMHRRLLDNALSLFGPIL